MTPDYSAMYKEKPQVNLDSVSTYRTIKSMIPPGASILELGCATGYVLDFLGGGTGVDIDENLLREASETYPDSRFVQADFTKRVPLPDSSFDTVLMIMSIEHLHDPQSALREAHRLMKDNGNLVIVTPRRNDLFYRLFVSKDPTHVTEYTVRELKALVSEMFTVRDIRFGSVSTKIPAWATNFIKPDIIFNCRKKR